MIKVVILFAISLFLLSCSSNKTHLDISSTDKDIHLNFFVNQVGEAGYLINFKNKRVIDTSYFSFDFKNQAPFGENLEVVNSSTSSFGETWETVWGEQKYIRNNYNELKIELKEKSEKGRTFFVVLRIFNDGVGSRFEFHEPIKPTGWRRTYPNLMTAEGLHGQEFNASSPNGGNPPEHLTIIPFTRMLDGPIDYTPGIVDIKFDKYKKENQVNTTLAQQLALYVVICSPIQMAADLPENYEGHPAFQFIRDVGVDWDTSIVLNGDIEDFITIARKEGNTDKWFLWQHHL